MARQCVLSMQEFANKIGKSRSWVSLLVAAGRVKPPPERLFNKPNSPLLFSGNAKVKQKT